MKIVTLSTYPYGAPRHGGQHRLSNIVAQYRANGHTVGSAGALGAAQYPTTAGFIGFPAAGTLGRYIENSFLMEDWAIGQWAAKDDDAFHALAQKIPTGTDLLHVEQPWLFEFALRYNSSLGSRPARLLYGSQNIENRLKHGIVESLLGSQHAKVCTARVLECELQAIGGADVVAAVSFADMEWMRRHTKAPVILAPNGVAIRSVEEANYVDANKSTGHHKFALYCASAHPPNITGFYEMFGRGIGFLAPDERLVVAGGAGLAIQTAPQFARTPGLSRHMVAAGTVSEETLCGLLRLAHAIVLPITQGEGTNLKTAEALWSGKHVVATPLAMRGFEMFNESPGVHLADSAVDFRSATRDAMSGPPLALSTADQIARRVVLWDTCLRPLVEQVNRLSA